jgi:hypothetical protein
MLAVSLIRHLGTIQRILLLANVALWAIFWIGFGLTAYPFQPDPLGHPSGTGYTFWGHSIGVAESSMIHPFFRIAFYVQVPSFFILHFVGADTLAAPVDQRFLCWYIRRWMVASGYYGAVLRSVVFYWRNMPVGVPEVSTRLTACIQSARIGFGTRTLAMPWTTALRSTWCRPHSVIACVRLLT